MSTRIRNVLRTSIAALAVSVAAGALVAASDVSAMGLQSFGGHGTTSPGVAGLGSHGLGSIGRGAPIMNRSLNGGAVRPMNMGRPGNTTMSRTGQREGLTRSTAPQTSRLQDAHRGSTGHHDAAPGSREDAKVKPNQPKENRTVHNAGTEKPPVAGDRRPERTDDVARGRDRYFRDRDDVPVLVPDFIPPIGVPTVEIVPPSYPQILVPNGPVINVTRGDPPKANPPPVVIPTAVFGIPGMDCPDPYCKSLLDTVLKRQAMLQEVKQDLASDEKKLAEKQKELADYQANLAKAKEPVYVKYWTDMIKIEKGSITAYENFIARDKELIAEVEGMLRSAIADWQDCVKRRCPDKPGAVVFDPPNANPDNDDPDGPF
jgi:hypothetical protein